MFRNTQDFAARGDVSQPTLGSLFRSLELLFSLGALDSNDNLTKLGAQLSQLPLDPMFGRVLVAAADMGCLVEALAVLAMVSAENVYIEPRSVYSAMSREWNTVSI